MSKIEQVKNSTDYAINNALKTFEKALKMVPEDKLDFKPADSALSIKDLATHVYMVTFVYTAGTIKGEFTNDDYSIIPFDAEKIDSMQEILDYGEKVKAYVRDALKDKLKEEHLEREVIYKNWGGFKLSGFASMMTILEEIIHHRGQLCVYLRILGLKPPFIYDFS
ncbi:MAG: DinB family protein [Candidatus Hodarchaeales archaeon]